MPHGHLPGQFKVLAAGGSPLGYLRCPVAALKSAAILLGGKKLLFILGPCVIESRPFTRRMGRKLKTICDGLDAQFVFKASYDKANRTSVNSFRGTTVRDGCALLGEIGGELGVSVTTDVHSPQEVEIAAQYIDLIQIPAFLCRQTDLILAAGASGRVVNVKERPISCALGREKYRGKIANAGCVAFFFTERGTTFGYNNLVADMRSIYWMQQSGFSGSLRRNALRATSRWRG